MLPSLSSFDKKVLEADTYLQLLIEQAKVGIIYVFFQFKLPIFRHEASAVRFRAFEFESYQSSFTSFTAQVLSIIRFKLYSCEV